MKKIQNSFEQLFIARHILKWIAIVTPVSVIVGSIVAFFLWLLDAATKFRWQHQWLLFLLPIAGIGIHFLYKRWGKSADAGSNLIMDEIHQPQVGVPVRMTPLILITTVITHLFGGSAGREGTAVQIGGSVASLLGKWFRLSKEDVRIILMAGVAAGFGAVFGTPLTGAIFALEFLAIGRIKYDALIPCLMASILADVVCGAWGIHHTEYQILFSGSKSFTFPFIHFDFLLFAKVAFAGLAFGLSAYMFSFLSHSIKHYAHRLIKTRRWLIPAFGGSIIILLTLLLNTQDYLGLGVTSIYPDGASIVNAFKQGGVTEWSWLWKLLFTAITLGAGFKGGEVTPLFFIGAALGNTIAVITGAPVDLFAGLGFVAVFAGATNTPLACIIMGIELFGTENVLYFAVACFIAYSFSGHSGIYTAQRVAVTKPGSKNLPPDSLLP
ncbi:MAG: voltage-gated chloride channel family protein [Taibaiella sp.]|nr:voltage-gated chloride channel family protein [Taibaiella sp.]